MTQRDENKLKSALLKRALGYISEDVVEEYETGGGEDVGEMQRLVKRKVTKKYNPPEMDALKQLIKNEPGIADLTDEELEAERVKLLAELEKELAKKPQFLTPNS